MSKEPYPSETADRFIVRFPDGMRDRIKDAAAASNRSMNAEIVARLEASFAGPVPVDNAQIDAIIRALTDTIKEKGGLFGLRPKDDE